MTRAAGCDAPGSSLLGDFYVTRGCETGEIFTAKRVIRGKSVVVPRESWRQRMEVYDPRCLTRANAPRPRLDARVRRLFLVPLRPSCSRFIRVQLSVNDAFSHRSNTGGNTSRDDRAKTRIYSMWDDRYFQFLGRRQNYDGVLFFFTIEERN